MSDEDVMDFSSAKSSSDTSDSESGVEKIKEKGPNARKKKKSQQSGKKTTKSKFSVFFEIVSKDKDTFGSCKLCKGSKKVEIKMKNRNTSGLKKHLLSMHKNEAKKLFPRDQVTPHVPNFFKCTGQGAPRNKDFTTATVDWITKKYLPFSFFDDQETQDYFRTICPNLKFPKRFTLRRQVQARFEELQTCVKDQLQKCTSKMSFTIDGWTSIAGRTFYGVTVHFIDNEWNYQSMVLDFVPSHGRHTGEDIARIFHRSLGEFNIENKVQGITVDNASANTKFMTELQKLLPDFDSEDQHFRCMAHILNLGVQDLLKSLTLLNDNDREEENNSADEDEDDLDHLPQIHDTTTAIMKLRSIFSKIKRSEVLSNKFRSACETAGVPITLSPMLDCPTRWGSTHDMLGVALKLKGGIITLCGILPELNNFRIFEGEWLIFEKIYKFLLNFKILTTKLGGDKYVTLPLVIVSFNLLLDKVESTIKQLDEKIDRTGVDERLIVGFQAARDKMLKHYKMTNWIYCTTLILDPRHKAETFDLTSWGTDIKHESLRKFEAIYGEYRNREPVPELPVQECQDCQDSDKEDIIDFNTLYSAPSAATASQASRRELEEYLSQPRAAGTEDILQWWRQHQLQFPILARMARDFLSIPATSVPAERLFSKASLVIRKHRNRLNNESARWLLCINSWATKTQ